MDQHIPPNVHQPRWLGILLLCLAVLQGFVMAAEVNNKEARAYGGYAKQNLNKVQKEYRAVSSHSERDGSVPEIVEEGRGAAVATVVPDIMGYVANSNPYGVEANGNRLRKRAMDGGLESYQGGVGAGVLGGVGTSRDINDWEIEDTVLLATVDGTLYARNRHTGKHLWALHSEKPVVETIDHREQAGLKGSGPDSRPDDDLVWIVEPVQDGGLYYFSPAMNGLKNLGVSVKDLVDRFAPFCPPGGGRVFNGEKKTVTYALDTINGNVTKVYSTGGSAMVVDKNCKAKGLDPLEDEHAHGGYRRKGKTILVGRTEYTVTIQDKDTEELLWTIKYAEWGPNNSDKDLAKQHDTSLDNRYIISLFDGSIMGFEETSNGDRVHGKRSKPTFIQHFPSPVVRVFDVVRSHDKDNDLAEYLILPQPKPPIDRKSAEAQMHLTFVGSTPDMNGWFAMTGANFPYSAANAATAKWYELSGGWHSLPLHENKSLLIGLHRTVGFIPHVEPHHSDRPTLDAGDDNTTRHVNGGRGQSVGKKEGEPPSSDSYGTQHAYEPALLGRSRVLNFAAYNFIDLLVMVPILGFIAYMYLSQRKMMQKLTENDKIYRNNVPTILHDGRIVTHQLPMVVPKVGLDVDASGRPMLESPVPSPIVPDVVAQQKREEENEEGLKKRVVKKSDEPESDGLPLHKLVVPPKPQATTTAVDIEKPLPSPPSEEIQEQPVQVQPQPVVQPLVQLESKPQTQPETQTLTPPPEPQPQTPVELNKEQPALPELPKIQTDLVEDKKEQTQEEGSTTPKLAKPEHVTPGKVRFGDLDFPVEGSTPAETPVTPKKKKTHRGQRGGAKKRKIKEAAIERAQQKEKEMEAIMETVEEIAKPKTAGMVPNVKNVTNEDDGTGDLIINNLRITQEVIGYGSHGTTVLKGKFEGKDVAVKRMLNNFYDVAKHEVSLLQESDDHPNVIRYYCKQEEDNFLYIALELCPASLHDLFTEEAYRHADLIKAIKPEIALYQITSGVRHLHSLKIVHRDLKPQNILVQRPKPRRKAASASNPNPLHPRFLISDFGLCKKLDGDQSSFRATTAHAAGTSGWRAPELLQDENTNGPPSSFSDPSENSGSASGTTLVDPVSGRRATKAIDIFSLGCVFYYVLSGGSHPFGDRWMREANIINSNYDLSKLDALEPHAWEAKDLISKMFSRNPKLRPDATSVMIHPFFWPPEKRLAFLLDVSDHFEAEPREPPSPHLQLLETNTAGVLGPDWYQRIDQILIDNLGKYRKYSGQKMLDLLRALRNKKHHYQDLPKEVQDHLGGLPEGFLNYFLGRFPGLLGHCYYTVKECGLEQTTRFGGYFRAPEEHA